MLCNHKESEPVCETFTYIHLFAFAIVFYFNKNVMAKYIHVDTITLYINCKAEQVSALTLCLVSYVTQVKN